MDILMLPFGRQKTKRGKSGKLLVKPEFKISFYISLIVGYYNLNIFRLILPTLNFI